MEPPGERLPLGIMPEPQYSELAFNLRPGDVIVFTSDGLPEAPALQGRSDADADTGTGAAGELFGFERLAESAARWAGRGTDADAMAAGVWSDLTRWCGDDSTHDDMTLLVLRVLP